jgi:hypothetical protein
MTKQSKTKSEFVFSFETMEFYPEISAALDVCYDGESTAPNVGCQLMTFQVAKRVKVKIYLL